MIPERLYSSLVIEILERGFQGPGRRMPGHCNDVNWLLGIFSAPETPDAAECQILKLCENFRELPGGFLAVFAGDGPRQSIREGANN